MITIDCPVCGNPFSDRCGENAVLDKNGDIIDYDRYYRCPHCGSCIDIQDHKKCALEGL